MSFLRMLGLLCFLCSVIALVYYAAFFDVSVSVPGGEVLGISRVNNIGLMSDRQNGITFSGVGSVIGLLLMVLGHQPKKRQCPFCKEAVREDAAICKHCGKDLPEINKTKNLQSNKSVSLHDAVWDGNLTAVRQLLDDGIDINQKNEDKKTALGLAKIRKDKQMVSLLESEGAVE